jgi:hypothetical protein
MIEYWAKEERAPTARAKMQGVVHSLLSTIDGSNATLPSFILAPMPHDSDKAYRVANEENYFPALTTKVDSDIGGTLAYRFYRVKEAREAKKLQEAK